MKLKSDFFEQNESLFKVYCVSAVSMLLFTFVEYSTFLFIYPVVIVFGFIFIFKRMRRYLAGSVGDFLEFYKKISGKLHFNEILKIFFKVYTPTFLLGIIYFIWAAYYLAVILTDVLSIAELIIKTIIL